MEPTRGTHPPFSSRSVPTHRGHDARLATADAGPPSLSDGHLVADATRFRNARNSRPSCGRLAAPRCGAPVLSLRRRLRRARFPCRSPTRASSQRAAAFRPRWLTRASPRIRSSRSAVAQPERRTACRASRLALTCPARGGQVIRSRQWRSSRLGSGVVRWRVVGLGCVRGRPGLRRSSARVGFGSETVAGCSALSGAVRFVGVPESGRMNGAG